MKYYIYVSDSKVDMLLSQMPRDAKRKIATEFKIDLKLLGASRKAETEYEENRFTRLDAVVSFVRQYGNLGTIDKPDEYIEDTLPMRWVHYPYEADKELPVVYFGGSTDRTIVGLGGSEKHLIGITPQATVSSHSFAPTLVACLEEELKLNLGLNPYALGEEAWRYAVFWTTTHMKGLKQRYEFMAKRLLYGSDEFSDGAAGHERKILLATPLYIAMAD
ncbi:MAG TPA: SAVMC3_10250 family protein [Pyrinomonadaceae bacterium]|nr:SAVMC3_10250 family protein [Pyrinomonadaceae bacterium]